MNANWSSVGGEDSIFGPIYANILANLNNFASLCGTPAQSPPKTGPCSAYFVAETKKTFNDGFGPLTSFIHVATLAVKAIGLPAQKFYSSFV